MQIMRVHPAKLDHTDQGSIYLSIYIYISALEYLDRQLGIDDLSVRSVKY